MSSSVLGELRDAGFGIAIDDFGTGYSSLAYLKQLPATTIKVDQTFTSQLPDPHDLSIVMAILAIADTYGLDVVAEGIETAEQAEVLKELGCPQGQGYHFARPDAGRGVLGVTRTAARCRSRPSWVPTEQASKPAAADMGTKEGCV